MFGLSQSVRLAQRRFDHRQLPCCYPDESSVRFPGNSRPVIWPELLSEDQDRINIMATPTLTTDGPDVTNKILAGVTVKFVGGVDAVTGIPIRPRPSRLLARPDSWPCPWRSITGPVNDGHALAGHRVTQYRQS